MKDLAYRLILAGALAGLTALPASAQQFVRVGSGAAGTLPIFGAKLAELINQDIPGVRATTVGGETEALLVRLERDEIQTGITYTFFTRMVADGHGQLGVPTKSIRHIMTLYGSVATAITPVSSKISSLADAGKIPTRVWAGLKTSILYPLVAASLGAYGVTAEDVAKAGGIMDATGYAQQKDIFMNGRLDVATFAGPIPYGLLLEIERSQPFRVLGFDEVSGKRYMELLPGTGMVKMAANSYRNQDKELLVPYFVNHLIVNAKMTDDMAYRITKIMNERYKDFHGLFAGSEEILPDAPLAHNAVPVHPGAEKYYREKGKL